MKKYNSVKIEVILLDGETDDVITGSPNDNKVNIDDIFGTMGTVVEEAYNTENN